MSGAVDVDALDTDTVETSLVPVCAGCDKLLEKDFLLAKCNHVFHADCLPGVDESCPRCDMKDAGGDSLKIFGACFSINDQHITPAQARLRSQLACQKEKHEALLKRQEVSRLEADRQTGKMEQTRRAEKRKSEEVAKQRIARQQAADRHNSCQATANEIRNRRAVTEYLEKLSQSSGAACKYLVTWAGFDKDPAVNLTEIKRIREYHKDNLKRRFEEMASKDELAKKNRFEKEKRQQSLADIHRKLRRCNSGGPRLPRPTLATRPRRTLSEHGSVDGSEPATPRSELPRLRSTEASSNRLLAAASSSSSESLDVDGTRSKMARLMAAAGAGG